MRKALFVAHWDWVLAHYRLPVATALASEGVEVAFVSPPGEYTERIIAAGFRHVAWQVKRRGVNPLGEAAAVGRLADLYRRERPDLVHHFTIKPSLHGSLAARLAGVPTWINTYTGLGYLFSGELPARVISGLVRPLGSLVLRGKSSWSIVLNRNDLEVLVRSGWVDPTRTRLIPGSGVDLERFAVPDRSRREGPPTVLLAARLLYHKGLEELVESSRLLRGRGVEVRFLVAGEADRGNRAAVSEEDLERWSRTGNVEFLGHRDDLPELLAAADIAVLPSYGEGLPLFLLEAAASGLPLVATDVPGCREVVRDGETGLLVPARDPVALADALQRVILDRDLRVQMGEAAHRLAEASFALDRVVSEYLHLYRDIGLLTAEVGHRG